MSGLLIINKNCIAYTWSFSRKSKANSNATWPKLTWKLHSTQWKRFILKCILSKSRLAKIYHNTVVDNKLRCYFRTTKMTIAMAYRSNIWHCRIISSSSGVQGPSGENLKTTSQSYLWHKFGWLKIFRKNKISTIIKGRINYLTCKLQKHF